jgi:hypothetical protein
MVRKRDANDQRLEQESEMVSQRSSRADVVEVRLPGSLRNQGPAIYKR